MSAPPADTNSTPDYHYVTCEVPLNGMLGPRADKILFGVMLGPFTPPLAPGTPLQIRIWQIAAVVSGTLRVFEYPFRRPVDVNRENVLRVVREPIEYIILTLELEVAELQTARDNAPRLVARVAHEIMFAVKHNARMTGAAEPKTVLFEATDEDVKETADKLMFLPAK